MKKLLLQSALILLTFNFCHSQAWMTSLDIAQRLALVQNKMVLMVWEETTKYPYPVFVNDDKGRTIYINNLYEDEYVSPLIWEHFIPVIVSENLYADFYNQIKDKRSKTYIDKFNDDSIKIMDVNGNIMNVGDINDNYQNISDLIKKYAFDTSFITPELTGFRNEKTFYSAYYLASKYLDLALYSDKKIRNELVDLSNIYLKEAGLLLEKEDTEEKSVLRQRSELLKIQEFLILKRPKKVLRQLKKMDANSIDNANTPFVAFLYYAAYMSKGDTEDAEVWKSKISLVNLKKAELIINLNT